MPLNYNAAVTINANYTGKTAIDQAKNDFAGLNSSIGGIKGQIGQFGSALKALAGYFAIREIVGYGRSILDLADNLQKMKERTGISVQALSALKNAAELGNVSFEELETGLKKFSVSVAGAGTGNLLLSNAFKSLGISVKDAAGNFKPTGDLVLKVADAFSKMQNGAIKTKIATDLFGRAGDRFIPFLNEGAEAIKKLGINISDDFSGRAEKFNDTLRLMGLRAQSLAINGLSKLLPTLQELLDIFNNSGSKTDLSFFEAIAKGARLGTLAIYGLNTALKNTVETIGFAGASVFDYFKDLKSVIFADATLQFDKAGQISAGFYSKQKERNAEYKKSILANFNDLALLQDKILKNFSNAKGAADATKPKEKLQGGAAGNADLLDERQQAAIKALDDKIKKISIETQLVGKSNDEKRRTIDLLEIESKGVSKNSSAYKALESSYKAAQKAQKEAQDGIQGFTKGAGEAFDEYVDNARNAAAQSKKLFGAALSGLEDAIVSFIKTGKLSFADLARTIENELLHIAVRRAIAAAIGTASSAFEKGGIMTSEGPVPLRKYAAGGVANDPQVALFGEGSTPEAYVPLPDGRSIPVSIKKSPASNNNVSVNVNIDKRGSQDVSTESNTDRGKQLGQAISLAITQALIKEKRPGGILAS